MRAHTKNTILHPWCMGLILLFLLVFTVEGWLWRQGYRVASDIVYTDGEPLHEFDPLCGWDNIPVSRRSAEDDSVWENVWPNGQRISRPSLDKPARWRALCIGDSMTFGIGVPDEETWVYRLNEHFPQIRFDNAGVPGTSSWQALLKLRRTLEASRYDLIIYTSINAHLARNAWYHVFFGDLQRNHAFYLTPRCELLANGELKGYSCFPPSWWLDNYLIAPNFFKRAYIGRKVQADDPTLGTWTDDTVRLFYAVVSAMQKEVEAHGARFILTTVEPELPAYFAQCPPEVEAVSLVYNDRGDPKYFVANNPANHPNGLMHKEWARMLAGYLDKHPLEAR